MVFVFLILTAIFYSYFEIEHIYKFSLAHHSTAVMDKLREVQKCLQSKNETRWNSAYKMLVSFLKLTNDEIDLCILKGKPVPKRKVCTCY